MAWASSVGVWVALKPRRACLASRSIFSRRKLSGVHLTGKLGEGVTATDMVLHITQLLRKAKVVGKFVEFYGPGAEALPVVDRATIANMAPEYGATMGFFGIDKETVTYLRATGRTEDQCNAFENYYKAQGLWGTPQKGQIDYSVDLELDLSIVVPGVAGPKRPQDHIDLPDLKETFAKLFTKSLPDGGYGQTEAALAKKVDVHIGSLNGHHDHSMPESSNGEPTNKAEMIGNRPSPDVAEDLKSDPYKHADTQIGNGSVLIAAITSCTNTSNPSVMACQRSLAKKAVERGLSINPAVKTSLAPGSRVVSDYLQKTGLQPYLNQLGFNIVGFGCTTCIGNSGPLHPAIEEADHEQTISSPPACSAAIAISEARIHQNIKANFLMSPPLVVAFALAGRINIDLSKDPIGKGSDGNDVYLKDIWPSLKEIRDAMESALKPEIFRKLYTDFATQNPKWNEIPSSTGVVYAWDENSTYIQEPPFFNDFSMQPGEIQEIKGARPLGIFGDSVTTDHISPAGAIKKTSPAGEYLQKHGVAYDDFNSYGSRRGNDRIMTRGTFANVRIKNLMVPGVEGGVTKHYPDGAQLSIYDASMQYQRQGHTAGDFCRTGIRERLKSRLGGKGTAPARREGGRRAKF